ncbi:hypothetical protein [Nannocystis punicea]|uniref:Uncharacterized protein n=1 Tax=Nannocystis punicea TaxID=2995304 RepID=A0ABY7H4W3_9BACT|nr:hypothetical protein [Nannocystis poenicansa]WAS94203.1 hypothetical protein O0S08_49405 [Nannocystis poenicansa]
MSCSNSSIEREPRRSARADASPDDARKRSIRACSLVGISSAGTSARQRGLGVEHGYQAGGDFDLDLDLLRGLAQNSAYEHNLPDFLRSHDTLPSSAR